MPENRVRSISEMIEDDDLMTEAINQGIRPFRQPRTHF